MRYASIRDPQCALEMRMRESTSVRTSRGRRRVHVLWRREGCHVNHKRIRRLYRLEGINLRCKTPSRRKSIVTSSEDVESSNARVRAECLNAHVFESLEDAKNILTNRRSDYNKFLPHSALGMLTPEELAALSQRNEVPLDQNICA